MRIIYGLLAFVIILFIACDRQSDKATEKAPSSTSISSEKPILVVTTIGMITDIVQNVGGDRVSATGLMGAGIDPHLYRASEGDVARLAGADLIFYNGLHLEGKMAGVLERMQDQVKTVAVTRDVDRAALLAPPEFEGAYDPHLWFDVTLWMKAVERVRDTLIEVDRNSAELYRANTENYLAKMEELHDYVIQQADRISPDQRVLVTAHDAFNYFGRAYGFEVRGLQGISTAS